MGQVVGISCHVCQTYPSASDLALCHRRHSPSWAMSNHRAPQPPAEPAHFKPTCVLWKVTAAARSWRFCHVAILLYPLGIVGIVFPFHQEKAQNSNNNTNNNTTALHSASIWHYHTVTSHSTDDDYIMQTRDTYHKHASGIPFSLCFHGKLNSGKTTALKLSGIQVSTVRTLTRHLQDCCLSPGTAHDITDSTSGVRKRLLTQLHALVKSSAVKEKCKSPEGWISVPVIKAGWNGLK